MCNRLCDFVFANELPGPNAANTPFQPCKCNPNILVTPHRKVNFAL